MRAFDIHDEAALAELAQRIKTWGRELGFGAVGISDADLTDAEEGLASWLEAGYHGEMDYMAKHGDETRKAGRACGRHATCHHCANRLSAGIDARKPGRRKRHDRSRSDTADTRASATTGARSNGRGSLIQPLPSCRSTRAAATITRSCETACSNWPTRIEDEIGRFGYRAFTDSAPVLEVALAQKAGVGWRGKHTLLLQRDAGSLFFLGEIYVDIPLPPDALDESRSSAPEHDGAHCGQCTRCIDACPTGAIVAPYRVDARRCISYLTIELKGSIPEDLRPLIGNRVYGCDDCQLVCPWNKFAQAAPVADFDVRHGLDRASLVELFGWSAHDFDDRMQGSAIRRIGHERWLRNIAVAMGNALRSPTLGRDERVAIVDALRARADDASELVREHVEWALLEEGSLDGID